MATVAPLLPGVSTATQISTVTQAARRHNISPAVLWGIYGAESTWGKGGSNWFGLVDVPRTGGFAGDADAAAATLQKLLAQHGGNLDAALKAYSGGSYGLAHITQLVGQGNAYVDKSGTVHGGPFSGDKVAGKGGLKTSEAPIVPGLPGSGDTLSKLTGTDLAGKALSLLTDPHTWIRVVEVIGGAVLIMMALKELTGGSVDPLGAARKAIPV